MLPSYVPDVCEFAVIVTVWLAPGRSVNDVGEMVKKFPLCVSVMLAGAAPAFVSVKLSVAPELPGVSIMPDGSAATTMLGAPAVTVIVVVDVVVPPMPV